MPTQLKFKLVKGRIHVKFIVVSVPVSGLVDLIRILLIPGVRMQTLISQRFPDTSCLFSLFRRCASHFEPEDWITGASMDHPSAPQHQRGLDDIALVEASFFFFSLCNIHLCINTSRGIFSILPYGQQLLFLPGCHLFSCYFFDFIFKQYNMENSNTECRTDGDHIQITDFQSHPNTSDRRGVGIKPDCWIAKSK